MCYNHNGEINMDSYVIFENWQYIRRKTEMPQYNEMTLHRHEEYELLYFVSGDAECAFGAEREKLLAEDVVLIPPQMLHGIKILSKVQYVRSVINFKKLSVNPEVLRLFARPCVVNITANKRMRECFNRLEDYAEFFMPAMKQQIMEGTIKELLYLLYITERENFIYPQIHISSFMEICLQYIESRLNDIENIDELCRHFHVSRAYLFREFKAAMNTSPKKYIDSRRLHIAENLIAVGENPTKVYLRCGYKDYSAFFKAYKRLFGVSPGSKKK